MSCWKILGIEQTADSRAIKRAYAARLKLTKPDEDPQGFSELHAAYKAALQQARYLSESGRDEEIPASPAQPAIDGMLVTLNSESGDVADTGTERIVDQVLQSAGAIDTDSQVTDDEDDYYQELQDSWQELAARTSELFENLYRAHKVENWVFLEETSALFDIQFKSEFSHFLFEKIIGLRERYPSDPRLPIEVIQYMNSIFRWTDRRDLLEEDFGYDSVESILGSPAGAVQEVTFKWFSPKIHRGRMEYGGYYARMSATVVDIILFLFIQSLLAKFSIKLGVPNILSDSPGPLAALLLYAVLAPIMEASPLQATPGKLLFGMKVVSPKGIRLNVFHATARVLIFIASTAAFKITVWINMFTFDGRLLHDRGSHSIVIKR